MVSMCLVCMKCLYSREQLVEYNQRTKKFNSLFPYHWRIGKVLAQAGDRRNETYVYSVYGSAETTYGM